MIFSGYLALFGVHCAWLNSEWVGHTDLPNFVWFPTPHIAKTTRPVLLKLLVHWNISDIVSAVSIDYAPDMVMAMKKVNTLLNMHNPTNKGVGQIGFRCTVRIASLGFKESFPAVCDKISSIRSLISATRTIHSLKRRNLYRSTKKTLCVFHFIIRLHVETRWSPTFSLIHDTYRFKPIFNFMTSASHESFDYSIFDLQ